MVQPRKSGWQLSFFTIWSGQAFSLLGSELVQFALVWWLTESTGSATVLATATLVALLPTVLLAPFAGALVDKWNRRAVMMVADSVIAAATVGLALIFVSGEVQVWHIYAIMFIRATAGGFHWPAMQASTSLMVPEEHLSRVAGLNQVLRGSMSMLCPPLGALLLSTMALQHVLAIDVGTALLALLPLIFVSIPQPEPAAATQQREGRGSVWRDVRAGLRYVWGWPGLLLVLVMGMLANFLFNPAFALLPILITDHFRGGAFELAWAEAAAGVGVVLGGLILSAWGGFRQRILTSMMGLAAFGLGILIIGVTPQHAFWLAVGGMFVVGMAGSMVDGPLFAVLQASVAPEMQGRVFTLTLSAAKAMAPLSLAIAGPVADLFGVRIWYVVSGTVCALMGVGAFFLPALTHFEDGYGSRKGSGPTPVKVEQMPR